MNALPFDLAPHLSIDAHSEGFSRGLGGTTTAGKGPGQPLREEEQDVGRR